MYLSLSIYIYIYVPVTSLPRACPPLAYLAVSPGCMVVSLGARNSIVISALARANKLGIKKQYFAPLGTTKVIVLLLLVLLVVLSILFFVIIIIIIYYSLVSPLRVPALRPAGPDPRARARDAQCNNDDADDNTNSINDNNDNDSTFNCINHNNNTNTNTDYAIDMRMVIHLTTLVAASSY